jgi:hypothetical protein
VDEERAELLAALRAVEADSVGDADREVDRLRGEIVRLRAVIDSLRASAQSQSEAYSAALDALRQYGTELTVHE